LPPATPPRQRDSLKRQLPEPRHRQVATLRVLRLRRRSSLRMPRRRPTRPRRPLLRQRHLHPRPLWHPHPQQLPLRKRSRPRPRLAEPRRGRPGTRNPRSMGMRSAPRSV
jgi:hypothetical protein